MSHFVNDYALRFAAQTRRIVSGNRFFYGILALFVAEASWIALTAVYPQAFDEQFHLGIIKIYASQWSPFFSHQPVGADMFGPVARDPSYLYHYLMSFPYRLITLFTHNLPTQVILLRFMNIGFLASSLFIYRRLLRSVPLSKAVAHLVLLVFVVTPVMPLLGSQINYDNVFIPLVGLSLLWTIQLVRILRSEQQIPAPLALKLLALCLFTSLVKYPFLPFFLVIAGLVIYQAVKSHVFSRERLRASVEQSDARQLYAFGAAVLVGLSLCVAMYGVNSLRYHTPVPDCAAVIGQQACMKYPPWGRDYQFRHIFPRPTTRQMLAYPGVWIRQSVNELNFAIASNFESDGVTVDYYAENPLPFIIITAWLTMIVGVILFVIYAKMLWQNMAYRTFIVASLVYMLILFVQDFGFFRETGQPVAIHGRYLLPVLPLLLAMTGQCLIWAIQRQKASIRQTLYASQLYLVIIGVLILFQGGGIITYIVKSDPDWLWPQNSSIHTVNHAAKKVLHKVVAGAPTPSD
jgi:hypothetical protein